MILEDHPVVKLVIILLGIQVLALACLLIVARLIWGKKE